MPSALSSPVGGDPDAASLLLSHAKAIAYGPAAEAPAALDGLRDLLEGRSGRPFNLDAVGAEGLRAIDILARGRDSQEACHAVVYLQEGGSRLDDQASMSEAPPVHAAAMGGNWRILDTLLDLGADGTRPVNAMKQQLLGSTPIHAVAHGFRAAYAEAYAQCFAALLAAGCDIDALDRKRQRAIDIAIKSSTTTGNSLLMDAMLDYGVETRGTGIATARDMIVAIARHTGNAKLMAQLGKSAIGVVQRKEDAIEALPIDVQPVTLNEVADPPDAMAAAEMLDRAKSALDVIEGTGIDRPAPSSRPNRRL